MRLSKFLLAALTVVAAGALAACGQPAPAASPQGYTPVARMTPYAGSLVKVQRGTLIETVESRGRVMSSSEALLSFELEGVLTNVRVGPGDKVSEGDPLAEIEIKDAQGRTAEEQIADAEYEVAKAQMYLDLAEWNTAMAAGTAAACQQDVEKAAAALRYAQAQYDRISWNANPDKPPEEEYDPAAGARKALELAGLDYDKAVAGCRSRDAEVKYYQTTVSLEQTDLQQSQALLGRAQRRAALAQLQAPFSGIVISWEKRVGERVEAYEQIGAVADPDLLLVEAWVAEEDIATVSVGQAVKVILDLHPDEPYSAEVVDVDFEPTVWQGKNVYVVDIEFAEPNDIPASIRMGADVAIETRRKADVLVVPAGAIYEDGGRQYVEVVRGNGRVKTEVRVGISDGILTEILAGIAEGEEVSLS